MKECIIKFGDNIIVSVVVDDQLVLTSVIKDISELCDIIYKSNIDSLHAIFQGTPASVVPNDSVKLSTFYVESVPMSCVCSEEDVQTVLDLCNTYNIPKVKIHSYLDFIVEKYSKEREVIVVDSWVNSYAIIYLRDGVVKDFRKTTSTRFETTLSNCKSEYNCAVINNKNQYDSVSLRSMFVNYSEINKDYLHTVEHIPFCISSNGLNLKNGNVDMTDWVIDSAKELKDAFSSESDVPPSSGNAEPSENDFIGASLKPSRNKKTAIGELIDEDRLESEDNTFNVLISIALVILVSCAIFGIISSVVYKGKVNIVESDIQILAKDSIISQQIELSLNGELRFSTPYILSDIATKSEITDLDSVTYENGQYSVTVARENEESTALVRTAVTSSYIVNDENFIGKFKSGDKEYIKTKFTVNSKP